MFTSLKSLQITLLSMATFLSALLVVQSSPFLRLSVNPPNFAGIALIIIGFLLQFFSLHLENGKLLEEIRELRYLLLRLSHDFSENMSEFARKNFIDSEKLNEKKELEERIKQLEDDLFTANIELRNRAVEASESKHQMERLVQLQQLDPVSASSVFGLKKS